MPQSLQSIVGCVDSMLTQFRFKVEIHPTYATVIIVDFAVAIDGSEHSF